MRPGDGARSRHRSKKKLIEQAYQLGESMGLSVWNQDEAGPYQTKPYPGQSWQPEGQPAHQPHEYIRNGTAKLLTLFHPADGQVRVKGVIRCPNVVLHACLKAQLTEILSTLPAPVMVDAETNAAFWRQWQQGLTAPITLPDELPPLRMLLIWDNLKGHYTPDLLLWLFAHGIMPLYTPLGGSWLNMAESIQRILVHRALDGQSPQTAQQIIELLEATAQGWNRQPSPFAWGGKRAVRRARARQRKHALGGSGACTFRPIRHRTSVFKKWQKSCQTTH